VKEGNIIVAVLSFKNEQRSGGSIEKREKKKMDSSSYHPRMIFFILFFFFFINRVSLSPLIKHTLLTLENGMVMMM
jgi:hypothetical protein